MPSTVSSCCFSLARRASRCDATLNNEAHTGFIVSGRTWGGAACTLGNKRGSQRADSDSDSVSDSVPDSDSDPLSDSDSDPLPDSDSDPLPDSDSDPLPDSDSTDAASCGASIK